MILLFLKKLILSLKLILFFTVSFLSILISAQAEIVKPTYIRSASAETATKPIGVELSPDGTKVFFARFDAGQVLYQYTLDTPFNISTIDASSEVTLNLGAGSDDLTGTDLEGFTFNGDGTKVYALDFVGKMNVHSLATPYDFSSFTQDADDGKTWTTYLSPNDGSIRPHDMRFNSDGSKMFLFEANADASAAVVEYHLATPYLPGSATTTQSFNVSSELTTVIQDIDFDDDGTRMYVVTSSGGNGNHNLAVYKLSTGFDVTTATHAGTMANFFNADETEGGTPAGIHFAKDGMKFYQVTYTTNEIHEYDLSCPYGIVICETDTASNIGAQVEFAKNVIHHNKKGVFKRFEWLRRNEGKDNLNTQNIRLNIHNPILASLTNQLDNKFVKKDKSKNNSQTWSYWSHGDITIGRVGDTATSRPKEVKTKGIMFGADKKIDENKFIGAAIRFGKGDVDLISSGGTELDTESLTLNLYASRPFDEKTNLDSLLAVSHLKIDQLWKGTIVGERNGKQLFAAFKFKSKEGYGKYNITPTGTIDFGITHFSAYTDFGTSTTNSADVYGSHTFETGSLATGFTFDNFFIVNGVSLTRSGSFEYVADLTPDTDSYYRNHSDNVLITNSIEKNSIHNFKGNIGLEALFQNDITFEVNYERFQGIDENSSHHNSIFFKIGHIRDEENQFALTYDPLKDNTAEVNYVKNINGYDLSFNLADDLTNIGNTSEASIYMYRVF